MSAGYKDKSLAAVPQYIRNSIARDIRAKLNASLLTKTSEKYVQPYRKSWPTIQKRLTTN